MTEQLTVEMIVKAVAEGFAQLTSEVNSVGLSAQGAGDQVQESGERASESSLGFTEMVSALTLAGTAFNFIKDAAIGSMNEIAALSDTVDNLSRAWGVSAEEASRVYQMADDLRISQGNLETGMRKLLDNGIQPSIASLKDLSSQYLAMEDPVQRAQFAMDMFGLRSGLAFQKILELGPQVIDTMSAANESLVMDDVAIEKMNEYQAAVDATEDSILALKIAFATSDLGKGLTWVANAAAELINKMGALNAAISAWGAAEQAGTVTHEQYAEAMRKFSDEGYDAETAMADLTAITYEYTHVEENVAAANREAAQSTEDATEATTNYSDAVRAYSGEAETAYAKQEAWRQSIMDTSDTLWEAKTPLDEFLDSMGSGVASPIASFIADLRFFMAGGGEIAAEFERVKAALSSGMITPGQAATILGDLYTETQSVMVDAGLQTQTEAAENISESLNVPLDAAYTRLTEIGSEFDAIAAIEATATLNVMTNILGGENEFEFLRQLANTRSFTIAINVESEISGDTSGDNGWGEESDGSGEGF